MRGTQLLNNAVHSLLPHHFSYLPNLPLRPFLNNAVQIWEIVFRPHLKTWQSAVRDGLLEAGFPYNGFTLDHAAGTKIGGSTFDAACTRHTSADLLRYAKPSNIRVAVYATVERLLLAAGSSSSTSAIGVLYHDEFGRHHHATVREHGEVIVSAGAIGSPQLLLLSGIGPRPYLSSWGISVVH